MSVLIVGSGPTGLTLAAELYRKGTPCRLIDQIPEAGPMYISKALGVHSRTLEILEEMGIADEFVPLGVKNKGITMMDENGEVIVDLELAGSLQGITRYPYALMIPQPVVQKLLERHLNKLGGQVEYGTKLKSLKQDDNTVQVVLETKSGTEETCQFDFVVGCDGAHSTVRKLIGSSFEGSQYQENFILADVRIKWNQPHDKLSSWNTSNFMIAAFPLPASVYEQDDWYRLVVDDYQAEETKDDVQHGFISKEVDIEKFTKFLAQVQPAAEIIHFGWKTSFNISHRLASKYQQGRVFIAGDAAHIHSPTGGQGMNTGMQDAYNLAWKLALVIKSSSPLSLLESYATERKPIAEGVLAGADSFTKAALIKNKYGQMIRNKIASVLVSFDAVQHSIGEKISQVAVTYKGTHSPLIVDHSVNLFGQSHAKIPPGSRAPDASLDQLRFINQVWDGKENKHTVAIMANDLSFFDSAERMALQILHRYGHSVSVKIILPTSQKSEIESRKLVKPPIETLYDLEKDSVFETYGIHSQELATYIVRPDGYVGYFEKAADPDHVLKYFSSFLM